MIQKIHEEVSAAAENPDPNAPPPQPYEVVSSKIQNIAHRTSLDSFVFPISTLLPEVCRYSFLYGQDDRVGADPAWPVQLFLTLGVTHDMITRVLGTTFETQDYGFSGGSRARIIELIIYVVHNWLAEIRRRGGAGKGGSLTPAVEELLASCESTLPSMGPRDNPGGADPADIRGVIRGLRAEVGNMLERAPSRSLRYL